MIETERVDLAHEADFALGRLKIVPPSRELVRDDGTREVLEHRVMQVLIALVRAKGGIVTRDALTLCCWDGRVVGEDAINRVISRLRRVAEGIGAGSFRIETITKVGYRLVGDGVQPESDLSSTSEVEEAAAHWPRLSRRTFAIGAVAAGIAGMAGGGALLYRRLAQPSVPPEAQALIEQAWQAWTQGTREGNSQAIGLYRRAVEIAPDFADGWGFLGCAYGDRSHFWAFAAEVEPLRERARAAGQRALELDSKNANGRGAIAYARPMMGNWLLMEREFLRAIDDQPDKSLMTYALAMSFARVGRFSEAAALFNQIGDEAPTAMQFWNHALSLWASSRLDEAERLLDDATSIYATTPPIWFARFNMLMFGGRPGAAIALAQDSGSRPTGVSEETVARVVAVARAIESRDPAQIDAVMAMQVQYARESAGQASRTIEYASAFGRMDEAFTIADAYFFSRGFVVPDRSFEPGQPPEVQLDERDTRFLFLPPTRQMRADPRFDRLVAQLGLERYWREAGVEPDYRRSESA